MSEYIPILLNNTLIIIMHANTINFTLVTATVKRLAVNYIHSLIDIAEYIYIYISIISIYILSN